MPLIDFDVFIIPGGPVSGMAFLRDHATPCINLHGPDCVERQFVLWHEVGHHRLGHTGLFGRSSDPEWLMEYDADHFALRAMRGECSADDLAGLVQMAKRHIRALIYPYLFAEIYNAVPVGVADWAGCRVTAAHRDWWAALEGEPTDDLDLPASDLPSS